MARYVNTLMFVGSKERLWRQIYQYLTTEGFKYENFEGEWVFKRGDGWLTGPNFFKVEFTQYEAIVQAWIKMAVVPKVGLVGEFGLEGTFGFAAKGPIKRAVATLEPLITTGVLQPGILADPPPTPIPPPEFRNPTAAAYAPPSQANFCQACGAPLNGGLYCARCGRKSG
ncbi:MAG: zinc ribbon domain-containing protein [Clostridia bacterium]|nr:zinc ribbon domain-containing protein [Clostridia bacterium]